MVSTRPLISKFSSILINPLLTVPRTPITNGVNVTFTFHSFHSKVKVIIFIIMIIIIIILPIKYDCIYVCKDLHLCSGSKICVSIKVENKKMRLEDERRHVI